MSIYGKKITKQEYEALIVNLFENSKNIGEQDLKKAELNLHIDYRLGKNFPNDRREKIWEIYSGIDDKIFKRKAKILILTILPNALRNYFWSNFIHSMEKEFLCVLSKSELESLFGIDE